MRTKPSKHLRLWGEGKGSWWAAALIAWAGTPFASADAACVGADLPSAAAQPAESVDAFPGVPASEALIAALREALRPRADGSHERLLRALRALEDPGLKPLFAQLAGSVEPVLRRQGILGLAELERLEIERAGGGAGVGDAGRGRVDLLLVKRISDPVQRAGLLGEALRAGLLDDLQLQDISYWTDLDPVLEVSLLCRLCEAGRSVDLGRLRALQESEDPLVACFAAVGLIHVGQRAGTDAAALRVLELEGAARDEAVLAVLDHARGVRLTSMGAYLRDLLGASGDRFQLRLACLHTLGVLEAGEPSWAAGLKEMYASARDGGERMQVALVCLDLARANGELGPAEVFGALALSEDELEAQIGRAGAAVCARMPGDAARVRELCALAGRLHAPTVRWSLRASGVRSGASWPRAEAMGLHSGERESVALAVIDAAAGSTGSGNGAAGGSAGEVSADAFECVLEASAALGAVSPGMLLDRVAAAVEHDDARLTETLLAGALRARMSRPETGQGDGTGFAVLAAGFSGWPSVRSEGLAVLLRARWVSERGIAAAPAGDPLGGGDAEPREAEGLDPASLATLGMVALGRGDLPSVFRVQAAWLTLKFLGKERQALAHVCADAWMP